MRVKVEKRLCTVFPLLIRNSIHDKIDFSISTEHSIFAEQTLREMNNLQKLCINSKQIIFTQKISWSSLALGSTLYHQDTQEKLNKLLIIFPLLYLQCRHLFIVNRKKQAHLNYDPSHVLNKTTELYLKNTYCLLMEIVSK